MTPLLHMKDKIQPGANKVWSVDMSDMAPGGISNYLRFEPNNENNQFFLFSYIFVQQQESVTTSEKHF